MRQDTWHMTHGTLHMMHDAWRNLVLFLDFTQGHDCLSGFELHDGNIMGRGKVKSMNNVEHETYANMFAFLCSGWLALWKIDYFNHFQVLERMCFLSKMLLLQIHSERKNVQFKPKVWARGEKSWRLFVLRKERILSDVSNTFSSHNRRIECSWIKPFALLSSCPFF